MKLTPKDRKVIAAFIDGDAQTSAHLTTDGLRLDGRWMGGNHIAFFTTGGDIAFSDLGSKAAQTVQRAIARAAPGSLDIAARYVITPRKRGRSIEARARKVLDVLPNGMPALLAMLLPIVLPMIVSATGNRLAAFRSASREEQRAAVRAVLQSKALLAVGGPPALFAARQAAKSDTVVDTLVAAIAQHGDAALATANAAAQAKLRKAAPIAATPNPRGKRDKVKIKNPIRNHHLRPGDRVEDHYGRRGSVVKAYPRDRYDVSFVGYGGQAIQLRGEYLTKINPRKNARRNGPVTNLRGPSVATLQHLPATSRRATATLTKTQAQELKTLLNEGKPMAALTLYDTMSRSNGVEYISGSSGGLYYVNHGDPYDTTLIYDTGKGVVRVGSWGDIVERDRRFRGDW